MLTPSISASSTSEPCVIRVKAFSTHVTVPPFLNQLPLAEEMTTGWRRLWSGPPGALPEQGPGEARRGQARRGAGRDEVPAS